MSKNPLGLGRRLGSLGIGGLGLGGPCGSWGGIWCVGYLCWSPIGAFGLGLVKGGTGFGLGRCCIGVYLCCVGLEALMRPMSNVSAESKDPDLGDIGEFIIDLGGLGLECSRGKDGWGIGMFFKYLIECECFIGEII